VALAAEMNLIAREGLGPFQKIYRDMQKVRPNGELFGEDNLNVFAHRMLEQDRRKEAIELLMMNLEAHPKSAKACDRLADAHLKNGDKELAIEFYKEALEIDPKFKRSLEALKACSVI
jgi:tetratricopeptide (TPR) repeat protein